MSFAIQPSREDRESTSPCVQKHLSFEEYFLQIIDLTITSPSFSMMTLKAVLLTKGGLLQVTSTRMKLPIRHLFGNGHWKT